MMHFQESCVVIYLIIIQIKITNQAVTCYHQDDIMIHSSLTKCKPNGSCQKLQNQQCNNLKRIKIMSVNLLYYIDKVEMVIQLQNLENCAIRKDPQLQL